MRLMTKSNPIDIITRHPHFDATDELATIWLQHEDEKLALFITTLMNSLSILFPDGERFFIRSVRAYKDQITDPKLQQEVKSFVEQEGQHTREHHNYNKALKQRGYDVEKLELRVKKMTNRVSKVFSKAQCLAATCAVEHFTAVLGDYLLNSPELTNAATPKMRAMWRWHAIEEIEHKAVAFDVYNAAVFKDKPMLSGYKKRVRKLAFFITSIMLPWYTFRNMLHMFRKEKALFDFKMWYRGWKFLSNDLLPYIRPRLKTYYAKNFHPWDEDNSSLVENWKSQYEDAEGNMLANY